MTLFAVPMENFANHHRLVAWSGVPHGYLYMLLIIAAVDLGHRVRCSTRTVILNALARTIPFLSFVAKHHARREVNR